METSFQEIFTRFVANLTAMDDTTVPFLGQSADEICKYLRIARLEGTIYKDLRHEALNNGHTVTFYDSGSDQLRKPYESRHAVQNDTIAVYSVYQTTACTPWNTEELTHIQLLIDTLFVFNGRDRLLTVADRFTYYDEDDYRNMRYFYRALGETHRQGRFPALFAAQFNLKHFALVNSQIGRASGNFVMRNFYEGLLEIIGTSGLICRVGGDNFIMLAEKKYVDQVVNYLSGTAIVYDANRGDRIMVSATAGIFIIPEDFQYHIPSDLMDCVMPAAQASRHSHTTDIIFYNEKMVANKERGSRLQRIFPDALAQHEFKVYYQPKVTVTSREIHGAEALCRWFHNGKLVPPGDFIPILESGMEICELDFYVLDRVCRDIRRWLDYGYPVVRISVNLSRRHMMDLDLFNHIVQIIDRHQVPHQYIEIELTETTTDVAFTDLKRVVNGLQQAGIFTSVDDFGMGYSSLNLIKEIPWNVLKVDRSFLPEEGSPDAERRSVMFKYVVAMARDLGLEVITEGVETEAQLNLLKDNNCELAQGFYFDKALPVDEFEERLLRRVYP